MLKTAFAAALLACTTAAFAQPDGGKARRLDCSKAQDPKACEERLAKAKAKAAERGEHRAKIREACKDKKGEELRACLKEQRARK